MIKAITELSDSMKYYWKRNRGKISVFMNNHIKIFSSLGYILTNMKARVVRENKKERRSRRYISGRRRGSEDCLLYTPARAKFFN